MQCFTVQKRRTILNKFGGEHILDKSGDFWVTQNLEVTHKKQKIRIFTETIDQMLPEVLKQNVIGCH